MTYSKEIFEDSLIKNLFVDLRTGIYIERTQGGMLKHCDHDRKLSPLLGLEVHRKELIAKGGRG